MSNPFSRAAVCATSKYLLLKLVSAECVVLILDIDMTVKPRGQACATGEVLGRLQAPIDHLGRGLVAVRCADRSPPSIVRRSASYGFRTDFCRWPRRCQYQGPSQAGAPGRSSYDRRRRYDSGYR